MCQLPCLQKYLVEVKECEKLYSIIAQSKLSLNAVHSKQPTPPLWKVEWASCFRPECSVQFYIQMLEVYKQLHIVNLV